MLTSGNILREKRESLKLTLTDIEKKTRIRRKYLTALEQGDWNVFPSKTYIIGIIRSYAKFLEVDDEKVAAFFRREYSKKEELEFKGKIKKKHLVSRRKRIVQVALAIIFLVFASYFGYQLKQYFTPPSVEILKPTKAIFKKEKKVELVGVTEKEAVIEVNGERVYADDKGQFSIDIPLAEKENKVIVKVIGANGKETVVEKVFQKR